MELNNVKKEWLDYFKGYTFPSLSNVDYLPKPDLVFKCFSYFNPDETKVVILGQDPYPSPEHSEGLCFSSSQKVIPQSLKNIFLEVKNNTGHINTSANLEMWAKQGVLLLNKNLTVLKHKSNSHKKEWKGFSEKIISQLSTECEHIVFMLWGNDAISLRKYIDETKHLVLTSGHPSPLNTKQTFLGNNHFLICNEYLIANSRQPIIWKT